MSDREKYRLIYLSKRLGEILLLDVLRECDRVGQVWYGDRVKRVVVTVA